jgi:hypothetical protein
LAGFIFRSDIHIGSAVEHILTFQRHLEKSTLITLDMFELAVFAIVTSIAIMSQNNDTLKSYKLRRTPIVIIFILAAYEGFYLILLPILSNSLIISIGFILGYISIVAFLNAIQLKWRCGKHE